MRRFNMLTIITGITSASRSGAVAKVFADKQKWKRQAKLVVGYTTDASASEDDVNLFRFVTEDEFAQMEQRFEFVHTDEADGIRYGYRLADIEATVGECDAVVVFHEFVEHLDRPALAQLKCGKRVVDMNNETVQLSHGYFGSMGIRDWPAD
ncbi:MAG: hypothetical protein V1738_04295 [Patescibacteria group bacterium]